MTRRRRLAAGAAVLLLVAAVVVLLVRGSSSGPPGTAVRTGAKDSGGHDLAGLSVVPDPEGGYLGVYYSPTGTGPTDFAVSLGASKDLLHWRRLRVLDANGGNMPTIRRTPDGGYLVAYEDYIRVRRKNAISRIDLRAYGSRTALVQDRPSSVRALPMTLSKNNEGTPTIESVRWGGSIRRSVIHVRFHYNADRKGIDRQGVGTLTDFRHWTTRRDVALDRRLERAGFPGSHGRRTSFVIDGRPWMLIEAQRRAMDFATWRLVLLDRGPAPRAAPRVVCGGDGPRTPSAGVPALSLLTEPGDRSQLFLAAFVFDGPAGGPLLVRRSVPTSGPVAERSAPALLDDCAEG